MATPQLPSSNVARGSYPGRSLCVQPGRAQEPESSAPRHSAPAGRVPEASAGMLTQVPSSEVANDWKLIESGRVQPQIATAQLPSAYVARES